jgi:hypothetical protein
MLSKFKEFIMGFFGRFSRSSRRRRREEQQRKKQMELKHRRDKEAAIRGAKEVLAREIKAANDALIECSSRNKKAIADAKSRYNATIQQVRQHDSI